MKFQIECNLGKISKICLICEQNFQADEARLIVCNDQGKGYGDICHQCIAKGGDWVQFQVKKFSHQLLT